MFKMREYQAKAIEWITKAIGQPSSTGERLVERIPEDKPTQPFQPLIIDPKFDPSTHLIIIGRQTGKSEMTRQLIEMLTKRAHKRWLNQYRYASHRRKVELLRTRRLKEKRHVRSA